MRKCIIAETRIVPVALELYLLDVSYDKSRSHLVDADPRDEKDYTRYSDYTIPA
jgi:hypothetical protein